MEGRSYPLLEARDGGREELPHVQGAVAAWAKEGLEELFHVKVRSGGSELFQILKDDAVKMLYSICHQIWKTQQWPQDWKKVSFHSNPKERQCQRMLKLPHNCTHLTR